MSLDSQITLSVLTHESSAGDIARGLRVTPVFYAASLSDGTGAGQAQVTWSDARTLAGSTETLNLASLADTRDGASVVVAITSAKVLYIKNTGASSLAFSGGPVGNASLAAGGVFVIADTSAAGMGAGSIAVTGSTGGTYEIVIVGEGSAS